jgi:hypothetical protein
MMFFIYTMPNRWNLLVLEMDVEQHVLPTALWNGVGLCNRDAVKVALVIHIFKNFDSNKRT